MTRILIGAYAVRFPLGGYFSWVLQWMLGFRRLGHEVFLFEKAGWKNACFDPNRDAMGDDASYGMQQLAALLGRHDLAHAWCFVDWHGNWHGMPQSRARDILRSADLLVDMGSHGAWLEDVPDSVVRVLVDGEPGRTQFKLETARASGQPLPAYDHWYTVGLNLGQADCTIPTCGLPWRPMFDPVDVASVALEPAPPGCAITTIMSWQAHQPVHWGGKSYGMKDVEFARFQDLPKRVRVPLEIAVAGTAVPHDELRRAGWRVTDAHRASLRYDDFWAYIRGSMGEFSVCKNVFVATRSGAFGDREAAYLAAGRPVVLQDTGFTRHLPTGEGLFAVDDIDEAAAAIEAIAGDWPRHSRAARELARQFLDAPRVLARLLEHTATRR